MIIMNESDVRHIDPEGIQPHCGFQCRVWIVPDEEGGFVAFSPQLRGAVSEGETVAQAVAHICEALRGLIACYQEEHRPIPWQDKEDFQETPPPGTVEKWIVVDVSQAS